MTIRFDERVAIVTGAGAGLGRSHAMLLASRGAKVVVNDPGGAVDGRGGEHAVADAVVAEIRASGGQAVANYDSVADEKSARNIIDTAMNTWGRIDALVNNAGILRDRAFSNMTLEVDAGATIEFPVAPLPFTKGRYLGVETLTPMPLIGGQGVENVTVTGRGIR